MTAAPAATSWPGGGPGGPADRRGRHVRVPGVTPAISARDLRKSYGKLRAVDGVTFEVGYGEFFGILGPNGAGKTTTLEMVEGLREPDGGEVTVLGMRPWPRNPALLPRIGVQLQASSFFERLSAREQLRTFADLYRVPATRADEMLEAVGLADMAGTRTEKLSGGQAQRLSIACALVHRPDVVFLDEPTGALDPQGRRNLWDVLRGIAAEGHTVVLTTHHMDEAETLCQRVAIMDHGKILQTGSPATLIRGLAHPVRISVESGVLGQEDARALADGATVIDDGVSLTFTTTEPATVLARLADRDALAGLQVTGATLEPAAHQMPAAAGGSRSAACPGPCTGASSGTGRRCSSHCCSRSCSCCCSARSTRAAARRRSTSSRSAGSACWTRPGRPATSWTRS